ncbi:DUF2947 domain-containing protein [Photobacterium aquimaris]|uniref:DUF2947 domain-containing protein n=1 Tax=Photobacterium aquimaris TaxID=512643 RepID=A0A2T3HUB4_9GAMM|nr:DUF2947 domain-containing protein [Photobacterium aquimaris]MCP4954915.1 DUF2947 domain-containing protein [Photobacterium aquimaris]OBU19036.1 hypothetical protein AYY21_18985 [Photobacterium aquimaris]PQJ41446.1 hypothetical protein BTN98_07400 [Photobacterium aquimaris]PST99924.1 DUF2947 domain-containing protein [Photobacterium aquimaris]
MNYTEFDSYVRKWIFTHASMPVAEADLVQIKPFTQARSAQLWCEHVSNQSSDADHFEKGDWAFDKKIWSEAMDWQQAWDSDEPELPAELLADIKWEDNTTIFFCYEKYNIIETKWGVFKRNWKNFLFFDDGPLLLGRKQKQVVWFQSNGTFQLATRP